MTDRETALLDAERTIAARLAGYDRDTREVRVGWAATRMAQATVQRIRTGETATAIDPVFVVVPRDLLQRVFDAQARFEADCPNQDNEPDPVTAAIRALAAAVMGDA